MKSERTTYRALSVAAALCACGFAVDGGAQTYPNKPIRMILGYAPGGATDILARLVAQKLGDALAQQVVVENRPGANGNIAAELIAKAPADGYTILMAPNGHTINASLYKKLPYHPVTDFSPISLVAFIPNILVVHPSLPARSVREFIALARANPDQLAHGSSGTGSPGHLAGEVFKIMTKVQFIHVAYKGTGPALIDLLGGHLQLAFPTIMGAFPHIKANKLRALGITSLKRSSSLPETPTISEAGVQGYEVVGWYGVLGPAGVPKEITSRLSTEIAKALRTPEFQERLVREGADPVGNTPDEFLAYVKKDVEKWAKFIAVAGIRFER